ncbi:regulatory protein RecX [uncultured Zhongshania sp.]|uniref:regulatory protein RecX n=1 Tax=uncultured Zhongshania sp. TaxID=1642288 RepID=UPI0025DF2CAD|nr:regulatory protein RecX [uncultured Zhongshania sp.]
MSASVIKAIRIKAMDFLARREYSRHELHQKLTQRFPESTEINSVLDQLIADGLQSDSRFADSFMRLRVNAGYGPQYIRAELRQRGVAENVVEDTFSNQDVDWVAAAQQLFEKKYGGQDMSDAKLRAKCQRYMQYKGFAFDHIRELF